jgi:coproporphyrinogen III oxidase
LYRYAAVPTFRADIRRFTVGGVSWFGGGADLTPYYLQEEDAESFHAHWRQLCDEHDPEVAVEEEAVAEAAAGSQNFFAKLFSKFSGGGGGGGAAAAAPEGAAAAGASDADTNAAEAQVWIDAWNASGGARGGPLYRRCKQWCDDYFYIPARNEHRGVGGLFFDDMASETTTEEEVDQSEAATVAPKEAVAKDADAFTRAVALNWMDSYAPIVARRRGDAFTEVEEKWHHQRRGRYVEFNLLYDRGVRFGLDGGRVESIMVSAPPRVRWDYNVVPPAGSREEKLVEVLRKPRNW